ncbi:hypothetical protein CC2G_009625 [Coprinopsis cinerea AmutBmut pab1-1]|nr:hypothetical protein CC2G_009625 [Coprinopsis cinerea AmutBmut pab1-1]
MVLPDKRVLWHPRHENKFVVGGNSQITLYEWAAEYPEIRHITSQHDLHHLRCFAWSPDPAFDDLLAVGTSTGRVDLIRLEATKQARQSNILSSGPTVSLPVRMSRSCNALAFCAKDPNYLAVGLDKIRNDSSLIVWDIISNRANLMIPGLDELNDHSHRLPSRPQPQIPRVDNRVDSRILQQHALTEVVSCVSFIPDTTHMLLAGVSHRWLRLFDLRSVTPSVTYVAAKVHGIATDPFDPHRIACYGDNSITVWDYRKLAQPLLMFSEKDATADGARLRANAAYTHVEFSNVRRGCLATLERDSSYVRFWDLAETRSWSSEGSVFGGSSDGEGKGSRDSSLRVSRRSWANLPWPTSQAQPQQPVPPRITETPGTPDRASQPAYVLADTRKTKNFTKPLASFTIVPSPTDKHPLASSVMIVNKDGDLELYQVHDTPKQTIWSSRGELAIGAGLGLKFIEGYRDEELWDEFHSDIRQASSSHARYAMSERDRASRSRSGAGRDESNIRGRASKSGHPSGSALFARDDDSFPLSGVSAQLAMKTLASSRTSKRGYSPASFRKYTYQSESRAQSRPPPTTGHGAHSTSRERHVSPGPGKRKPSGSRPRALKGVVHVIEEDISMVMRKRALKGYGLSKPWDNSNITQDDMDGESVPQCLSEVWAWVHHSRDLLCNPTPRLHGYDFSYQGLLGLWEGFQPVAPPNAHSVDDTPIATQRLLDVPGSGHSAAGFERQASRRSHSPADDLYGNWNAAISALMERRGSERSAWKPSLPTTKLHQRQLALQLCGWSLRDEELKAAVRRWEKEGKISRAACWLVFTKQYSKAMDLLMRSNDEMHQMMSGTIAALTPHNSSALKNPDLREHYSRLAVKLQDPYCRMMVIHMGVGDWTEVLEEDVIPFRERLAIAFQFLDDRTLSSYLQRVTASACQSGNIDALIVTGLTSRGLDILQAYVDRTGDVQTAAIMGSYVCPVKFQDRRVDKWLQTYRDLLDGFRLHHERVGFDIERGQLLLDAVQNGDIVSNELVPPQILIRCHYCNKPVNSTESLAAKALQKGRVSGFYVPLFFSRVWVVCTDMGMDDCISPQRAPIAVVPCLNALFV